MLHFKLTCIFFFFFFYLDSFLETFSFSIPAGDEELLKNLLVLWGRKSVPTFLFCAEPSDGRRHRLLDFKTRADSMLLSSGK